MERIILNYNEVREQIPKHKTQTELAKYFNCREDKIRTFMNESDLYAYYCEVHNNPYHPQEKLICSVCETTRMVKKLKGVPYCKKHYNHMYRYGHIIEKTIYDKNDYINNNDGTTSIVLRDVHQNVKGYCVIDTEDVDKVKEYKWYLCSSGNYCITKGINKNSGTDIGNVIFNDFEAIIDHQDHDRLNNKKSNLRKVTFQQNSMNMGKKYNNTSGVTGVQKQVYRKIWTGRWTANITYNYKSIWRGCYKTFDEAVVARLEAEAEYFKEYSPNYNPGKQSLVLQYQSQTDNLTHYIEMNLSKEIITNIITNNETNKEAS